MDEENMNHQADPPFLPTNAGEDELSTLEEEARRLKVPLSWMYSRTRIKGGDFPVIRIGKYIRVYHKAVMAWIEKQNQGAA